MSHQSTDKHVDSLAVKVGKLEASQSTLADSLASLAATVREGFSSIYQKIDHIVVGKQTRWSDVATIAGFVVAAVTALVLGYVNPLAQRLDMENRHAERLVAVNADWQRRFDELDRHWSSKVDSTYSLYRGEVIGGIKLTIDDEVRERQALHRQHIDLDKKVTAIETWRHRADKDLDEQRSWASRATRERNESRAEIVELQRRIDRLERRLDGGPPPRGMDE